MKNGLTEIIKCGVAPGVSTGAPAVDHSSVYYKAPRGLAAVESEPLFRHGPARGASRIAKHFGMSTQFIKDTWKRAPLIAVMFIALAANAGDFQSGVNFSDGQTVSAAQMNNIVNNATVNNSLISGKPVDPAPLGSDTLLIFSPTLNGLYRLTLNSGVLQNPALITAQSEKTTPISADYLLLWDSVGLALKKVSAGNLALNNTNVVFGAPFMQATNLDPQVKVPISNYGTNAVTTASNLFSVQVPLLLTNLPVVTQPTNTDLLFIWSTRTNALDTNGATPYLAAIAPQNVGPYTLTISNLASINGTNLAGNPAQILVTNMGTTLSPFVELFVVVTNTTGLPSPSGFAWSIGDEIPAVRVLNTSNLPAYSWRIQGSRDLNVFGTFATNTTGDLQIPNIGATNAGTGYALVNHTNFNLRVYITQKHQQ